MIGLAVFYLGVAFFATSLLAWSGWVILAINAGIHSYRFVKKLLWRAVDWLLLLNSLTVVAIKVYAAYAVLEG